MAGAEWKVPVSYTRDELALFLTRLESGHTGRMEIAQYAEGGGTYVMVGPRPNRSLRFNRLRVVDDPQYARDLAAILLTWADHKERKNQ